MYRWQVVYIYIYIRGIVSWFVEAPAPPPPPYIPPGNKPLGYEVQCLLDAEIMKTTILAHLICFISC